MLDRVRHTNTLFLERRHSWPSFPKRLSFCRYIFPFFGLYTSLIPWFWYFSWILVVLQHFRWLLYIFTALFWAWLFTVYVKRDVLVCGLVIIYVKCLIAIIMQFLLFHFWCSLSFFFYFLLKCYCVCDVVLYNIFEEKKLSGMCWYWLESNQERCQSVDLWLQLLCFSVHIWLLWWFDVLLYTTVDVTAVSGLSVKMCPSFWDYFQCPCFMFNLFVFVPFNLYFPMR